MLSTIYTPVKAANPDAQVLLGGLAYDWFYVEGEEDSGHFDKEFLNDVLAFQGGTGGDYFDVMNFHYYRYFHKRWDAYGNGIEGKAAYLRQKLGDYGLFKPFVVTEAGTPVGQKINGVTTTEDIQARYVFRIYGRAFFGAVSFTAWFPLKDWTGGEYGLIRTISAVPALAGFVCLVIAFGIRFKRKKQETA